MPLAFTSLICSQAKQRKLTVLPLRKLPDWRVRRFTSEQELNEDWPRAERQDDFWLCREVLGFQLSNPQGIDTEPLVLENIQDGRRVLLTAQTFYFNAGGQVSDDVKGETSGYDFRRRLLAPFSFRVLCLGQFLVSGAYSTDGLNQLSDEEAATVLPALADTLMASFRSYAGVMIKDLYPEESPVARTLGNKGYYPLPVDPVLKMEIPPHWLTLDDYLADLKSKYRVRYRRARTRLEGLSRRPLSPAKVLLYRERIYELYRGTSAGSDFNATTLTSAYFPWLATEAPRGKIHGYFTSTNELVGFTSSVGNGGTFHAHFIGIEEAYKKSHHLYHNILFDFLEDAILGGFQELDYGRTAPEIKTSVGAVASESACLLRARSGIINRLVPVFTPAVYKADVWTPRNPFR